MKNQNKIKKHYRDFEVQVSLDTQNKTQINTNTKSVGVQYELHGNFSNVEIFAKDNLWKNMTPS